MRSLLSWIFSEDFNLVGRDYALVAAWLVPVISYYFYRSRRTLRAWGETARLLNLSLEETRSSFQMKGLYQNAPVLITAERRKSLESWLIRLQRTGQTPLTFTVRARSLNSPVQLRDAGQLVLTGDPAFDEAVRIQSGDPVAVISVFSDPVRERVFALMARTSTVISSDGIEFFESEKVVLTEPPRMAHWIKGSLEVLALLQVSASEKVGRLAESLVKDPHAAVRLNNLSVIIKRYPKAETSTGALRAALKDPDPVVRLCAAVFLREKDLGRCVQDLAPVQTKSYPPGILADVMDLLLLGKNPVVEPVFIRWLYSESAVIKLKAVESLGRIGTSRAVGSLHTLESGLGKSDLKTAARKSIELIKSRVDPHAAGSLSLSDVTGADGALSLPQEGGELSLEEHQKPLPENRPPDA